MPRLVAEFDDPNMKSFLVGLDQQCAEKPPIDAEQMLQDVLSAYERRATDLNRRATLIAAQKNDDDATELLNQFYQQSKSKQLSEYKGERNSG